MHNLSLINREISWLHFNARVLQEAVDQQNPLFERLRFIGIYSNNRDEFFRVRVATMRRLKEINKEKHDFLDYDPAKTLKQIRVIIDQQEKAYMEAYLTIRDELRDHGFNIVGFGDLNTNQVRQVKKYFTQSVHPYLFPIMLRGIKDVEGLRDNSIYLVVRLSSSKPNIDDDYALVKVPTGRVSRFFLLPDDGIESVVVLLDDVIRYNLEEIFLPFGYDIFEAYSIKFTRDAELDLENDLSKSFLEIMAESLKQRKRGAPVRFIYDKDMPARILDLLLKKFKINKKIIILIIFIVSMLLNIYTLIINGLRKPDQHEFRERHIVATVEAPKEVGNLGVVGMIRHDEGKQEVGVEADHARRRAFGSGAAASASPKSLSRSSPTLTPPERTCGGVHSAPIASGDGYWSRMASMPRRANSASEISFALATRRARS